MTVLLAVVAVAIIAWTMLPLFGKETAQSAASSVSDRDRAVAADVARAALDELEADFAEGKVDPEGYETAKAELNGRLAALGKGAPGKRAGK